MARYFRVPFANAGDKETIPDPVDTTDGTVSYTEGYGDNYSLNPATEPSALNVERDMFNQLAFDITDTLRLYYETGVPPFITAEDNGGTAFSYPIRSRVLFNNRIYESTTSGNTNTPDQSGWTLIDIAGNDARYARRANNLSDLANATAARTNLGLGSVATRNVGTVSADIGQNSYNDGRFLRITNNLSELTNQTDARNNLELGDSATRDVGTDSGELMEVGAFGLGGNTELVGADGDLNFDLSDNVTRFINTFTGTTNAPTERPSIGFYVSRSSVDDHNPSKTQTVINADNNLFFRIRNSLGWQDWQQALTAQRNLSELTDQSAARTNLGLQSMATRTAGETADTHFRNNLQNNNAYYPRATADSTFLQVSNNLSDLGDVTDARDNLELGTAATRNVGTDSGELMEVGAFGLGGNTELVGADGDLNFDLSDNVTRFINTFTGTTNAPTERPSIGFYVSRSSVDDHNPSKTQTVINADNNLFFRIRNSLGWQDWQQALTAQRNLSDLDDEADARTNLGLGTAATLNTGTSAGNLPRNSDLGTAAQVDTGTAPANVPTITQADARYLREVGADDIYLRQNNNLSDLENAANARTNLELRGAATREVGTAQDRISLISNSGIGGHTLVDQDDGSQEFENPDQVNRNGLFYFSAGSGSGDGAFPSDGPWFVFSMVHGSSMGDPNSGIKSQIAVKAGEAASEEIFVRGQDDGNATWSDWNSLIMQLAVLINFGFSEFFTNFHNGNFFEGMY